MSKHGKPASAKRREFFKLLGLAGATGAAAIKGRAPEAQAAEAEPKRQSYRETAHVKKFYELAKF
jgi:hypothetical protein